MPCIYYHHYCCFHIPMNIPITIILIIIIDDIAYGLYLVRALRFTLRFCTKPKSKLYRNYLDEICSYSCVSAFKGRCARCILQSIGRACSGVHRALHTTICHIRSFCFMTVSLKSDSHMMIICSE